MDNSIIKGRRLLFFGVISFIIGIFFEYISYIYQTDPQVTAIAKFLVSPFSSAGIAIMIIALVQSKNLKESLKETSDRIVENSSNRLDAKFKILRNCKENGLIDILPPRQDEDKIDITRKTIAEEIEKANSITIFSISALDFFTEYKGPGLAGMCYAIIHKRLEEAQNINEPFELKIKVLLMNPDCKAAEFRNKIEQMANFNNYSLKKDVETSIEGIKHLNKIFGKMSGNSKNKPLIELRLYSEFPQVGFILTDNCIFVEPYHFAPTEKFCKVLKQKNLKAGTSNSNCTGGRIPVFMFEKDTNMYIAMDEHFESIWEYDTTKNYDL